MKRAVIYARYSTDLQNDQSVEDQIRLCMGHAGRLAVEVVGQFHDRARSGASMFGRPGLSNLMQLAEAGGFDVLISEAPDRISRDIADLAHIHKTLKFRSVEINCVNGGLMDTLQIGMHGVIGQMQREEGAKKVKRGMIGVVKSGRHAGGRAYGYRPIIGQPGELEIIEEEAAVVRRIFDLYAAGVAPRTIAGLLNDEGIAPPRGSKWNASTINGNGQRGHGLLLNTIYVGKLVWNRVRMVKDPSTGRRISRVNDPSEHETVPAEHLRIMSDDLFRAVALRKASRGGEHARHLPKNKRILSGLLKCGACGGGLSMVGADRSGPRVVCSSHRESGTCTNNGKYYVEKIERQVVDTLRIQFSDTKIIDAYVKEYEAEKKRAEAEMKRGRAHAEKSLQEAVDAISAIVLKMARNQISDEDAAEVLPGLRAERERWKIELARAPASTNIIEIKPKAVERFRHDIEELADTLANNGREPSIELAAAFRRVIAKVVVAPRKPREHYNIEILGYLTSLVSEEMSAVLLVAGEGLEPPTRGL